MEKSFPIQQSGKWIFHLQHDNTLQFHIASEQEGASPLLIEGHEISVLLDYLYSHRELIYEATHDQELRKIEALEAQRESVTHTSVAHHIELTHYFDDGERRVRADF
jgi:hypothetical protein